MTLVDAHNAWRLANDLGERALIVDIRSDAASKRNLGVDARVPFMRADGSDYNYRFLNDVNETRPQQRETARR